MKFFLLVAGLFLLTGKGCDTSTVDSEEQGMPPHPPVSTESPDVTNESAVLQPMSCQDIGKEKCNKPCRKVCDGLFPRSVRAQCYLLKKELVREFKTIVNEVEQGSREQMSLPALSCFLDLSLGSFIRSIKVMSAGEAKAFLKQIAKDPYFANILMSKDKNLKIIRQLLKEASKSPSLTDHLNVAVDVQEGQSFLWLLSDKKNTPAFQWLNSYVKNQCPKSITECPKFESIGTLGAYCQALLKENHLDKFLSSAQLFEQRYKRKVEKEGYEYKIMNLDYTWHNNLKGDFRDFCQIETQITDGERAMRKRQNQLKSFGPSECSANLRPVKLPMYTPGIDSVPSDTVRTDDVDRLVSGQHVWNQGNLFGSNYLKGVGDMLWYLSKEEQVINWTFNNDFNMFIKKGQVIASPHEIPPKDPKAQKVRRALFWFYVVEPDPNKGYVDPHFPNCIGGDRANTDTCPYFYCLVDYELSTDTFVKTCEVLKCALGRPAK